MIIENLIEKIKECKNYSEVGSLLGYNYYNGSVKKVILRFCHIHSIDIEKQIFEYKNRKTYCLYCGKELTGNNRLKKKFCNSSCAAKYNNKQRQPKTKEEKQKISESLIEYYKTYDRIIKTNNEKYKTKTKLISECIRDGLILNPFNVEYKDRVISETKYSERTCVVCGNKFKPFLNACGHLYKGNTCSNACHSQLKQIKGKEMYNRLVKENRFQGWKSRNILSYPEKFWIQVLENNNVKYISNKPFKSYFLDFYIELDNGRKIDLEIDGKQHKYQDRLESDTIRDKIVNASGIEVYRVEWNEINSEDGKATMKKKIDNFLQFLKWNIIGE